MSVTPIELYNEFLRISESGDEGAARAFLTERLAEFPEETRDEIVLAFFEEALLKNADAIQAKAAIQQEGMDALLEIQKAKREFESNARIDELKGTLGINE